MSDALKIFLLGALHSAGGTGMTEALLLQQVRLHGFAETTEPQLAAGLRSLADESLAISFAPIVGPKRWRVTARGTSALQEAGLA